jgi:hypothetical protein
MGSVSPRHGSPRQAFLKACRAALSLIPYASAKSWVVTVLTEFSGLYPRTALQVLGIWGRDAGPIVRE